MPPKKPPGDDLFSALDEPAGLTPAPRVVAPKLEASPLRVSMHLAEVAVEGPLRGSFTYSADLLWDQLVPGARVLVPFGHRTVNGFFLGKRSTEDIAREAIDPSRLKAITKILDAHDADGGALLTPTLLQLARWIAHHYACPLGNTLSAMLPAGVKRGASGARVRIVTALVPAAELLAHAEKLAGKKPRQSDVLLALAAADGVINAVTLMQESQAPDSALKALAKAGLLSISEERAGGEAGAAEVSHDLALNAEQQQALSAIETAIHSNAYSGFLLQGVTGSGKTEVYLRALKTALAQNKQAIVLVPEIALTPQTAQRFESRLGRQRVAVLHSHVTDGDRAEAWRAIRAGKIDVVVGARSALFAPLPRLGVIVIDEEHENAFKQESVPRYHARDVAIELARLSHAVLVLGSATPSFEALYMTRPVSIKSGADIPVCTKLSQGQPESSGETTRAAQQLPVPHIQPQAPPLLAHLRLNQRVAGRPLPPVEIIDMTRENKEVERYSYLSRALLRGLEQTLGRREQSILFMNRRGFATVITCLRCGQTEKCLQCDIALTSHRKANTLNCHYCNYTKPIPDSCSFCGALGVKHWGMGTERVEEEVRKAFSGARVARMDSDTMLKRTNYLETLGAFRAGNVDILIGTQMIAKGLDFPNVTLVGVVMADTALHMPDFRCRERTFQLLAQVAGRAGRGEKGGRVIIQTHLPGDPAIRCASKHDFDGFIIDELAERRAYNYPPFTRLARIIVRSKDQPAASAATQQIAGALRAHAPPGVSVLGPADAPLSRIEGFYRQHVMIKSPGSEGLSQLLSGPCAAVISKIKGAEAVIDVDAIGML